MTQTLTRAQEGLLLLASRGPVIMRLGGATRVAVEALVTRGLVTVRELAGGGSVVEAAAGPPVLVSDETLPAVSAHALARIRERVPGHRTVSAVKLTAAVRDALIRAAALGAWAAWPERPVVDLQEPRGAYTHAVELRLSPDRSTVVTAVLAP